MKQFILVAGNEYRPGVSIDFAVFCRHRITRLRRVHANDETKFIVMDFRRGTVTTTTYARRSATPSSTRTENLYDPITRDHYPPIFFDGYVHDRVFNAGSVNVMSVISVYNKIYEIGEGAEAGTLWELSFISHGAMGGPILANSYRGLRTRIEGGQRIGYRAQAYRSTNLRDPLDLDPRIGDFAPPNITPEDILALRNAFHADGYIRFFGCAITLGYLAILRQVVRSRRYREHGLGDAVMFDFIFTAFRSEEVSIAYFDPDFFPADRTELRFSRSFGQIKDFFRRGLLATYSYALAYISQRPVYAALLGTGSELTPHTMRIAAHHSRELRFYYNYLGINRDPERLDYGEYAHDMLNP